MTSPEKWIVLLPPEGHQIAAEPRGTFESEQAAWDWVAQQPTVQGLHMRVIREPEPY